MKRTILLLTAVAAVVSIADYLAWRASQRAVAALVQENDLDARLPVLADRLRRQTEPTRAATLVAWGLLNLEVDRGRPGDRPSVELRAEAARSLERLRQARRLAEWALPRRPSSWQAAMALGATRYLEAERTGARSAPVSSWWRPLEVAMELAPERPEPPLFLASASLSRWSGLTAAERAAGRSALARALRQRAGLELLLPAWVRLAGSLEELLAVVPDQPAAWHGLAQLFLADGDLERFATVRERWLDSLGRSLPDQVTQAFARARGGDRRVATRIASDVVAAPADPRLAPAVSRALHLLPDDLDNERTQEHLRRWLHWALDQCLLSACPLEAVTISRLARLAGDLHPATAAAAALAAGDPRRAAELAAAAREDGGEEWRRYRLLAADRLRRTDAATATRALDRAAAGAEDDPLYWRARAALAETTGDPLQLEAARRQLARLAGNRPADAWSFRRPGHRLLLYAAREHRSLRVELGEVPPGGAAVELRWDGEILAVETVRPGEELLHRLPVRPGVHELVLTNLSGRPPRPGAVRLEGAPPAT